MVFYFGDLIMSGYESYMRRALELAKRAEGCTSPNPMVGCVIADEEGNIVGEGWHHKAGTPHAEVNAIADMNAKQRQGHTAFVTLEPCSHWGRTGPCCEALLKAGIRRVVAAMEDPNPKVAGNGFRRLKEAGVEVSVGVCEKEARRLNEHFLLWVTRKRPFVSLKFAETLDGKLATSVRDSHFVTGQEAHTYSHYLRKIHDAILVGIGTVLDDDPELTTRLVEGKNPVRIVLDSRARIPLTAKVLQGETKTLLVAGPNADADKCHTLQRLKNVEVVKLPCEDEKIPVPALLQVLYEHEVASVLVEGGSDVLGSFLDAQIADRVYAFIAPKLVGGKTALPSIGGRGIERMSQCASVEEPELMTLGKDWLITGRVTF
ncbi:MAG: bifunctional diaminohydroxyphosphoribosylaminopyrimidine deaminase/5-amino-6-(5-phosphoribosylamino)uracil reductase RibD [Acidaminococcaceae bacterium]|nr:bifunctional diaminohydroxyphosphoribosylaminopyrimidine deaminase/5-amino-6-(5-phosphoribosylamino)uracil reductase RibD [Acidaminococcaceae bacterium]